MKVLVVGRFYSEGFATHIAETLTDLGHNVLRYEPGYKQKAVTGIIAYRAQQLKKKVYELYEQSPAAILKRSKELEKIVSAENLDLVLSCHDFLYPSEVSLLKSLTNAPIVLWFPDAMSNFGRAMFLDADYDFLFFKDRFIVETLSNEYAKNAYYLPECCNPKVHQKVSINEDDKKKYQCQISTAGNMHTARSSIFKKLKQYDIKIWGNAKARWMDTKSIDHMIMNKYVLHEEKAKAFLCASIVLNSLHPAEVDGLNVRSFEIAACGAFQLVSHRAAISDLFDVGEIVTYQSLSQLQELIEYFLPRDNERNEIANRAHVRVHRDHTYEKRLSLLLATVAGKESGYVVQKIEA